MTKLCRHSLVFVCLTVLATNIYGQSPIVLRDLTLIRNATVAEFDENDVTLSDGRKLAWDIILKAEVAADQQPDFDRFIHEIGLPRMRLKTRIRNGDWLGAGEIAEPLFESFESSTDESQPMISLDDQYLISLATMRTRLHQGKRAGAIWPFIQSSTIQSEVSDATSRLVGDQRLTAPMVRRFLSDEILPVWLSPEDLTDVSVRLSEVLETQANPRPGILVYLASMQIEVGETDAAQTTIHQLTSVNDPQIAAWIIVFRARIAQLAGDLAGARSKLESGVEDIVGPARIAALYYRGLCVDLEHPSSRGESLDRERARAMLSLLRIPAIHGVNHPDISAAALYQSAEIAKLRGRDDDEQKLRNELLKRYPRTYHGNLESNRRSNQR